MTKGKIIMNTEKKEIIVPGQLTGPALLTGYLIKEVSVAEIGSGE